MGLHPWERGRPGRLGRWERGRPGRLGVFEAATPKRPGRPRSQVIRLSPPRLSPPRTAIRPILRSRTQPGLYGIILDVLDQPAEMLLIANEPIEVIRFP